MSSSPRDALRDYAQPLQAALHCVTSVILQYSADEPGAREILRVVTPPGAELRRRDQASGAHLASVYLRIDHHISTLLDSARDEPRRYRIATLGYNYAVLDQQYREILSFHWHPGQRSHEYEPHLHVGSAVIDADVPEFGKTFSRMHIPTGQVSLARVVRMLLTDFQVMPNRQDWDVVLGRLVGSET